MLWAGLPKSRSGVEGQELQRVTRGQTRPLPSGISTHGVWRFEGYTLDERSRTLTLPGGEAQRLNTSSFLVLQYLLLHVGQLCGHDELLAIGWTGRKVQANSVAKCISLLRRLLADESGTRIRLTHGYGYQLILQASYEAGEGLLERASNVPEAGEPVPGRPEWTLAARIGTGACGEVHAATHVGGQPPRAYKFAIGERGLRGLKRELLLQRYLQNEHPAVDCLLPVVDAELERAPYFLATPLQPQGNLAEWAKADGQLAVLPREARLAIARTLCESVAQLHSTGLAHRDLKPQNLYLRDDGGRYRVLLGDLGAGAGMLPPGVDGNGLPIGQQTRLGSSDEEGGSELYLAPELLAGCAATIQSDLYALGLLVFQLAIADLRRTLAPGWEAELGDPLLAGDIAEAANLNPAARPASAAVLAERLRSLDARRVALRDASRREILERELAQERRYAAHRRRQLTVLLGLSLFAVVGLLVMLQQYRGAVNARADARAAQQQAEREAQTARSVLRFMNHTLLDQADPWGSGTPDPAVKTMLERAAKDIDQRFAGEPAAAAAVHEALADAWEGWGNYGKAIHHSRRALDLLATLESPSASARAGLLLKLCRQARMAQQLSMAESACNAGAGVQRVAGQVSPQLEVEMAKLQFERGRCDQTLQRTDRLLARPDADPAASWLRDALWFRGLCHGQTADFALARQEFERLLALPWDSVVPAKVLDRAWVQMDFAEMLVMEGDFSAAAPLIDAAVTAFTSRLGREHPDTVLADYHRARIRFWSGDPGSAVQKYQRVLDNWSRTLGPEHLWTLYAQTEQLWAHASEGIAGAERDAARARLAELRRRTLPPLESRKSQRSFFTEVWAWTALALDDTDIATVDLGQARADAASLPANHPRHGLLDCIEAELLDRRGARAEALQLLQRCIDRLSRWPPDNYRWRWVEAVKVRLGV